MPEGPVPYTSIAGCEGPAYIGLSSEQIKAYNEKAKKRRAEEAAAKEKTKEARQQLGKWYEVMTELIHFH